MNSLAPSFINSQPPYMCSVPLFFSLPLLYMRGPPPSLLLSPENSYWLRRIKSVLHLCLTEVKLHVGLCTWEETRRIHSLLITNPLAAPPLPSMVSLPAGKVVHCCRQITSDCWLLLPLIESEFSFLHQSICMRPDLSCLQFDQTRHKAL